MAIWWSSSMEDANNWDLNAVVRGCSANTSAALDPFHCYPAQSFNEEVVEEAEESNLFFPDPLTNKNDLHELEEVCKPFFLKSHQDHYVAGPHQPREEPHRGVSHSSRSKRRKNQQKKVVCLVPADGLPYDMWAWRKYGQKPIKGSPYPRGYYRCSSSKGCLARKQVERSRTDPTMLIITYTAEHKHPVPTHRNSLAGSTRNKFPPLNKTSSSPQSTLTMTSLSPTTAFTAPMEEENGDDEEEEGIMPVGEMTSKEDTVLMEEKLGGEIDDEDFVQKFLSNIWQIEGSTEAVACGR